MNAPFLTEVDPEIAVKGSIDPLGLFPLWSRHGRQVVGNLSLVASSTRGFTTLLLGYHFVRRVVDERELPEARFIELFLKFEQMTAYSRLAAADERGEHPGRVLGLRRVRSRLTRSKRVPIGSARKTPPRLERELHRRFAERRTNLVNQRKELFNITLQEIELAVTELHGEVELTRVAEAAEYRQSLVLRRKPSQSQSRSSVAPSNGMSTQPTAPTAASAPAS